MTYRYDTNALRHLMEDKQAIDAELSREYRKLAGSYETNIRRVAELTAAVEQAIECLNRGEADAALAVLADAVLHG